MGRFFFVPPLISGLDLWAQDPLPNRIIQGNYIGILGYCKITNVCKGVVDPKVLEFHSYTHVRLEAQAFVCIQAIDPLELAKAES